MKSFKLSHMLMEVCTCEIRYAKTGCKNQDSGFGPGRHVKTS